MGGCRQDCFNVLMQSTDRQQLYAKTSRGVGVSPGSKAARTAGFGVGNEAEIGRAAVAAEAGAQIKNQKEYATESGRNHIDPFFSYSL
jgi:hypothetical protein